MFILFGIIDALGALFFAIFGFVCLGDYSNKDKALPLFGSAFACAINAIIFFKLAFKFESIEKDLMSLNSQDKLLNKSIDANKKEISNYDKKFIKLQEQINQLKKQLPSENEESTKKDGE